MILPLNLRQLQSITKRRLTRLVHHQTTILTGENLGFQGDLIRDGQRFYVANHDERYEIHDGDTIRIHKNEIGQRYGFSRVYLVRL